MEKVEDATVVNDEVKSEEVRLQEILKEKEEKNLDKFLKGYEKLSQEHLLDLSPILTFKASGVEPSFEVVKLSPKK